MRDASLSKEWGKTVGHQETIGKSRMNDNTTENKVLKDVENVCQTIAKMATEKNYHWENEHFNHSDASWATYANQRSNQ